MGNPEAGLLVAFLVSDKDGWKDSTIIAPPHHAVYHLALLGDFSHTMTEWRVDFVAVTDQLDISRVDGFCT